MTSPDASDAPFAMDAEPAGENESPTFDEPLRGLPKLARVALVGLATLTELAARPIRYIWRDIAIAGIVVLLAGAPGDGKTSLLFLLLAARLNTGSPVSLLGREVTPAPADKYTVLVEAEHSACSAARKLFRSCETLGVHESALERLIVVARAGVRIGSPEWIEIERLIGAGLVSDIAIDTLARVAPGDANAEAEQVAIFERITTAIERAPGDDKPVVWAVAHTKKGSGEDLEAISGSVQRVGQADTVVLVKAERRDGRVTSSKAIFLKLREEPDEYPAPVEYTITREGIVGVSSTASDDRPLELRIEDRLALGPLTKNALATKLGRSAKDVDEAISALFDAKRIRTTEVKARGRTWKAFELRSDAERNTRLDTRLDASTDDTR